MTLPQPPKVTVADPELGTFQFYVHFVVNHDDDRGVFIAFTPDVPMDEQEAKVASMAEQRIVVPLGGKDFRFSEDLADVITRHFYAHPEETVVVVAVERADQADEAKCAPDEQGHEAAALTNLGMTLREARRFDEAISALQDAAAIYREVGDRHGQGTAPLPWQATDPARARECVQ